MTNNIKKGDLVLYMGGLFRVNEIKKELDTVGNEYLYIRVGDLWITGSMCRKADWRDITRITKGGIKHD